MSLRNFSRSLLSLLIGIFVLLVHPDINAQRRPLGQAYQLTYAANYDPSMSPDGKKIVYISVVDGREQLFLMNSDGSNSTQITRDDSNHEDPAWSPDGKKIAFVYIKENLEIISIMNVDGTGVERLSPSNSKAIHPNWSPNGEKLAYCTDDDLAPPRKNDSDIMVIDMSTRQIKTLITGGVNTYPAFSPDGKHIAFRRMLGEMNSEVFVADIDGTNAKNISSHPAFDGWPAWSPDGKRIAFASNRNSSYQIFTMNPDGTDVRLVANTDGRGTAPKWSVDGERIYFSICRNIDFGNDCQIFAARVSGFVR